MIPALTLTPAGTLTPVLIDGHEFLVQSNTPDRPVPVVAVTS